MHLHALVIISALAGVLPTNALADFVLVGGGIRPAGPVSPYYLDDDRNIYVVQGTSVQYSFPLVYGAFGDERVLAVSKTVNTRPEFTPGPGEGGQYTLTGTPTGVTEPYPLPAGLGSEVSYDGTSDGSQNFYVEHFGSGSGFGLTFSVYATDLTWQNPQFLFSLPPPVVDKYEGIAYDRNNSSLWISGADTIWDYSLNGNLLSSFPSPLYTPTSPLSIAANAALGYDPSDHTLWISYNGTNLLEQYSTTGELLQYGTPTGLPNAGFGAYESGDFSNVPEPSSVVLLATAAVALLRLRPFKT
jgi:hypothetical protein